MTNLVDTQTQVALVQMQMRTAHNWLEGTMQQVTPAVAHWLPAGTPGSIGAQYAHVALTEDFFVQRVLRNQPLLMAGPYAGQLGLSELPPVRGEGDWGRWSRAVQVELDLLRAYARAVYSATEDYLVTLSDDTLYQAVDASDIGLGVRTAASILTMLLGNAHNHCGEISALKGMQGLKGYPA